MAMLSYREIAERDRADLGALQLADRMTNPLKHLPDLVLPAFVKDDLIPRVRRLLPAF